MSALTRETLSRWARASAGILLSVGLLAFGRGSPPAAGSRVQVVTSFVASDALDLDCDAAALVAGERCAFSNGQAVPGVIRPLHPFVSWQREVFLLSGVFETPEVAAWLATARAQQSSGRVRVDCEGSALGTTSRVGVRWRQNAPFDQLDNLRVIRVDTCLLTAL
jgi:hypothetical protein